MYCILVTGIQLPGKEHYGPVPCRSLQPAHDFEGQDQGMHV